MRGEFIIQTIIDHRQRQQEDRNGNGQQESIFVSNHFAWVVDRLCKELLGGHTEHNERSRQEQMPVGPTAEFEI